MRIKGLIDEDFIQYKEPSMFIITSFCDWKCCNELNLDKTICQNSALVQSDYKEIDDLNIVNRYLNNSITKAIVFGGLEPFEQFKELKNFIEIFRIFSDDTVIIYTGFYPDEIKEELKELENFSNIIIKFGRFIPDKESHFDEVLGVELASPNQFAERLDKCK